MVLSSVIEATAVATAIAAEAGEEEATNRSRRSAVARYKQTARAAPVIGPNISGCLAMKGSLPAGLPLVTAPNQMALAWRYSWVPWP